MVFLLNLRQNFLFMDNTNRKFDGLYITLITIAILLSFSFFGKAFQIGKTHFKNINIFSELTKPPADKTQIPIALLQNDSNAKITPTSQDSILMKQKADTLIVSYHPEKSSILGNFFASLLATKNGKKKTRIAYFGDSMIEGDLITQNVRNALQKKFGGKGVGFVPITSVVAGYRKTIKHTFSNNWEVASIIQPKDSTNYGISGYVFHPAIGKKQTEVALASLIPKDDDFSWVKYNAPSSEAQNISSFKNFTLFFGPCAQQCKITYNIDGAEQRQTKLTGGKKVNSLVLNKNAAFKQIEIQFYADTLIDVFGVSIDSDEGLYLDNFAMRGNSGLGLTSIPTSILSGFNSHLDYDLIVLQFGINVSDAEMTDFSWYEKGMQRVVKHLQNAIPEADILIVGVGDRSYKKDGEFITQPSIPILIEAQRNVAKKTNVAFWNLYQAMGGYNSMVEWVNAPNPLANKDYTHVNATGAAKIANMFTNHILNEFAKYEKKHAK